MKYIRSSIILLFFCNSLFAGGLVTNTNQSASWVRMPSQNASTSASAVFFNPAGLMQLENGFHLSLSNQFISQNRKVENFYQGPDGKTGLNNSLFEGSVFAPLFPTLYAVYKRDNIAFSIGVNPVGGGGSAVYDKGLPSFEMKPSDLVYSLNPTAAATGVSAYNVNSSFEGSSVYMGYQAGISFKVSDEVSLYGGLRYVTAKNTYNGYLKDIEVNNYGDSAKWNRADAVLNYIAGQAGSAKTSTGNIIAANAAYGNLTLAEAEAATILNAAQRAQLEGALTAFGYPTNVKINVANAIFAGAEKKYKNNAILLGDQEADVEETGSGITPIIGINIAASEKVNIGIKFEGATFIELTRNTTKDVQTGWLSPNDTIALTMFPDGRKYNSDMPAMLTAGIDYQVLNKLKLSVSGNLYFDRTENLSYGKKAYGEYIKNYTAIDHNSWELAGGIEFNLTDKILLSGGVLTSNNSVNSYYQSDQAYSLDSKTFCLGAAYNVRDNIMINLGIGYTKYAEGFKVLKYELSQANILYPKETYYKDNMFVGIGVDFSF